MDFELFGRLKDDGESGGDDSGQAQESRNVGSSEITRTVESMFDQGYSEEEIRSELEGRYPKDDINRAINNVVTSSATGDSQDGGPEPMSPYQGEGEAVSPMDEGYNQNQDQNQQQNQNQQRQESQGQQQQQKQQPIQQENRTEQGPANRGDVNPQIEELIETIIAENFQKVEKEFQNVYDEMDMIEEKLADLESRVHDLEVRDDEDQKEFVKKMDEVEDHIDSYESRIGGLEKAFQQILPSLVDNIRDLTSLVQEIKQEQGIETDSQVSSQDVPDIDMDAFEEE
jgi:hypothetical protein